MVSSTDHLCMNAKPCKSHAAMPADVTRCQAQQMSGILPARTTGVRQRTSPSRMSEFRLRSCASSMTTAL